MNWFDRQVDGFIRWVRDHRYATRIPIGPDPLDPTYWRYFVIPRNRWLNIYLHNFHYDDPEDLHDHRAANITIVLQGEYYDQRFRTKPVQGSPLPRMVNVYVRRYRPKFRRARLAHRVVLLRDTDEKPIGCWSLFIKLPDTRDGWGFWCPGGGKAFYRPYQLYASAADPNAVGYGQRGAGCE